MEPQEQDLGALAKEQLRREGKLADPGVTVGDVAKSVGGGVASGIVSGTSDIVLGVGRALQGVGVGMVSMLTGAPMDGPMPEGDPITAATDAVASFTRNTFPSVESIEKAGGAARFFARTLPEFAGAAVPYLAGGEIAAAAKAPAFIAQKALPMFMGAMASGHAGFQDAVANGASAETAWSSYLLNAGVGGGAMGLGPLPKILARAEVSSAGMLSRALQGASIGAGQTFAADLIAQQLYDDSDRNTAQKMLEMGAAGGLSSVLLESLDIAYRKLNSPPQGKVPTAADVQAGGAEKVDVPTPAPKKGWEPTGEATPSAPEAPSSPAPEPAEQPQAGIAPAPAPVETRRVPPPWTQQGVDQAVGNGFARQPQNLTEMAQSDPATIVDASRRAQTMIRGHLEHELGLSRDEVDGVIASLANHLDDSEQSQRGRRTLNEWLQRLPPDVELRTWMPQGPDGPTVRDLVAGEAITRVFQDASLNPKARAQALTDLFGDPGPKGWSAAEGPQRAFQVAEEKLAKMPEPESVKNEKMRNARARPAKGAQPAPQMQGPRAPVHAPQPDIQVSAPAKVLETTPKVPGATRTGTAQPPNAQLVGNPSMVQGRLELPDKRSLPVSYGVVEAASLQPSHDPTTFKVNPLGDKNERSYDHPTEGAALREGVRERAEKLNPAFLVTDTPTATDGPPIVRGNGSVLGGNGRTMSIQLAYRGGKAEEYRAAVHAWAQKNGIDASGLKEPVLVRVVSDEHAGKRGELSADLNDSHTMGKTPATVAISRGSRIDEQAARAIAALIPEDGSLRDVLSNPGTETAVISELVRSGAFSDKEVLELSEGGRLTEVGKQAVEQAVMGAALPDIYALRGAPVSVRNALMKSLAGIIRARAAWPDLSEHLAAAVEALTDAKAQGLSVGEAKNQVTIEPRPWKDDRMAVALAQAIESKKGRNGNLAIDQLRALFSDLGDQIQAWRKKQGTMFGPPPPTAESAFWGVMTDHGIRGAATAPAPADATPNAGQTPEFFGARGEPFVDPSDLDPDSLGASKAADPILGGASDAHAAFDADEQLNAPTDPLTAGNAGGIGYGKGGLEMTGELSSLGKDWDGVEVPSRQQIVKAYAKLLQTMGMTGAEFRLRRISANLKERKMIAGAFFIKSGVLRLARGGDISTAPHEFAHALEKVLFGIDMKKGNPFGSSPKDHPQSAGVLRELEALGKRMYGPNCPPEIVLREGWAEFWREWFNRPEKVGGLAPETTNWVEGPEIMGKWPELAQGSDQIRNMVDTWRRAGGTARIAAGIAHPSDWRERKQRVIDKVKAFSFQESFIDVGWALKTLQEHAIESYSARGATPEAKNRIHDLYQQLQMTAGPVVRDFMEHGTHDILGQKTGFSYGDAIKPAMKGGRELFEIYQVAKRAVSVITDPLGQRDPGFSIQDARAALADIEKMLTPEEHAGFDLAQQNYETWFRNVNRYCSQLSDTYANVWKQQRALDVKRRQMDPDWRPNYAPLKRDVDPASQILRGYASSNYSLQTSPLRRMKGSSARVISPLWEGPIEAERRIQGAQKLAIADAARRLEKIVPDVGNLITKVPPDFVKIKNPTYDFLLSKIEESLNKNLTPGQPDINIRDTLIREGVDPQTLEDGLGERMAMFMDTPPGPNGQPTIALWNAETKKVDYYEVSLGMQKALTGMSPYRLQGALAFLEHGLFQVPKQMFTMGTTGLRLTFSWITNPTRDIQTLYLNTASKAKAPELAAVWAKTMKNALSGALQGKSVDWAIDFYKAHGLEMNLPLGQDTNHVDAALNKAFGRDKFYRTVKEGWDTFKDFMQVPEMVTRVTEIKAVAKANGWEPGMPMSEELAQKLVLAAKNVSVNFTQGGELARAMNRIAPFFNASIQGPYAGYQAYKRNPASFMLRGLSVAASSAALWWLVKDQDWYKELPAQEKYGYWHVPYSIGDQKGVWRVPMSHEIGTLFGSLPMAMLDALNEQDPRAAADWAQTAIAQTMPNVAPVLLNEALMQASNTDFFSGTPIVPRGQEDVPVDEQFGDYTTRASQLLGRMFGWSPRRIDHAIRGVAGTAAIDLWSLSGRGTEDRPFVTEPSDVPVIGTSFQRGGQSGTQPRSVTDLYDLYARYYSASRSSRDPETRENRARRLMLSDATQAISAMTFVRSHTNEATKRNAITDETIQIARDALKAVQGADIYNRGQVHSQAWQAKKEKERIQKHPDAGGGPQ